MNLFSFPGLGNYIVPEPVPLIIHPLQIEQMINAAVRPYCEAIETLLAAIEEGDLCNIVYAAQEVKPVEFK